MNSIFWYDRNLIQGKILEVEIDHPGLLYGATVFSTLRVYEGNIDHPQTNWLAHLRRLSLSLQTFDWQIPDWKQVRQGAEILKQHFPVLRITIFPDGRELITGRNLPGDLTEKQKNGMAAWVAPEEMTRSLPSNKTGNYLPAWLALQQAQKYGAKDAILIDASGNWLETSTGNLWGWRDRKWWTPPLGKILPGLMREMLIERLTSQNEIVGEQEWTAQFVAGLEAIAISNSVVEVIPIHTILTTTPETPPSHILHLEEAEPPPGARCEPSKIQNPKSKILSPTHPALEKLRF